MSLEDFAEWFCLKDHKTFMVQPNRDPDFYFGRSDLEQAIKSRLDRGILLQGVPKMVLYGAFGAGKTHTLYHIKWYLEHEVANTKFEVRYVEVPPDLSKKSKFVVLHQA